ncbi:MAG: hypothetical protein LBM77_01830 [Spirochaetaceae bacterium]|nr:hypothetical protein [Spirochaetaceae bacterium]
MTRLINGKEISQISHEALELRMQGKVEESREMLKLIPIYPPVAWAVKRREGVAGIRRLYEDGCDMSEVEAKYGKAWTEQ